jgi:ABC-type lipoprotein export system ATPase subunit
MNIILKSKIKNDKYTEYIYDTFDIQNKNETIVSIPMNLDSLDSFEWNIGVVYGNSGSGKSTILKKIGNINKIKFDEEKALISNFDWLEPSEAARVLTSMGLSSVPTWLRPFNLLSNGEQYRAELAYLVSSAKDGDIILIDEYTSVVDRDVAKAMSFALQKYIRRENKKIILASCHNDIMEWLMPDWTLSPQKGGTLERGEWLRQGRPYIELQISRVEPKTWDFFKKHHYLTENVNNAYMFFLFEWNEKPVAIGVIGRHIGRNNVDKSFRGSRTVVLPDYQGMGIGSAISNFLGGICVSIGAKYYTKTINPALGIYRNKNTEFWKPTPFNNKIREQKNKNKVWANLKTRASFCHQYIGPAIYGYETLLGKVDELRNIKKTKKLNKFFE